MPPNTDRSIVFTRWRQSAPYLIHGFWGPWVYNPKSARDRFRRFCTTDHRTCDICSNRPQPGLRSLRCGLIITIMKQQQTNKMTIMTEAIVRCQGVQIGRSLTAGQTGQVRAPSECRNVVIQWVKRQWTISQPTDNNSSEKQGQNIIETIQNNWNNVCFKCTIKAAFH